LESSTTVPSFGHTLDNQKKREFHKDGDHWDGNKNESVNKLRQTEKSRSLKARAFKMQAVSSLDHAWTMSISMVWVEGV
jgi:hypothetical protein